MITGEAVLAGPAPRRFRWRPLRVCPVWRGVRDARNPCAAPERYLVT